MTKTEDKYTLSSMDDDDDIMQFLREKDNEEDYSLFKLAVSKLSEPSNVLELLEDFSVEDKRDIFKSALEKFESADDEDIKSFLEKVEHDAEFCKKLLPKMSTPSEILEVLENFSFEENKQTYKSLISVFEDADDEEIKDFLTQADHDPEICKKLFPKLSSTSVILEILDDLDFEDNKELYKSLIPLFEEADEEEDIKSFLNKIDNDNPEFFQKLLPKMENISEILEVLDTLDFEGNEEIYRDLISKFEDADDEDIKSFIANASNDLEICKKLIPKISDDEEMAEILGDLDFVDNKELYESVVPRMEVLSEILNILGNIHFEDGKELYLSLLPKFEDADDEEIKEFLKEAEYDPEICGRLIPKLSDYSETLEVLGEIDFSEDKGRKVFEDCIKEFEDADDSDIKDFLDKTGYDSEFCKRLLPKMSDISEILEVLGNLRFEDNEESFRSLVPIFEGADDEEIKDFLREASNEPEMCEKLFPKIRDNSVILDLLGDLDFDDNREVFEIALEIFKETDDEDRKAFLHSTSYDEEFCKRILPYVEDDETKDEILEEVPNLKGVNLYKEGPKSRSYEKSKPTFQSSQRKEEVIQPQSKILSSTSYERPSFSSSPQPSSSGSSDSVLEELKGKSDYQIMDILKKYEDNPEAYKRYLNALPFEEWTDFRISNLLQGTRYNLELCIRVIPCVKSDYTLDSMLDKFPSDPRVFHILLPRLGLQNRTEFQLTTLLERTKYSLELCKACVSFLSSKEKIFLTMEKTRYNEDVCTLGLNRLRNLLPKI
jgi:hypothetical protein